MLSIGTILCNVLGPLWQRRRMPGDDLLWLLPPVGLYVAQQHVVLCLEGRRLAVVIDVLTPL